MEEISHTCNNQDPQAQIDILGINKTPRRNHTVPEEDIQEKLKNQEVINNTYITILSLILGVGQTPITEIHNDVQTFTAPCISEE